MVDPRLLRTHRKDIQTVRMRLAEKAFGGVVRSTIKVLALFLRLAPTNDLFVSQLQGEKNNGFDVLYHNMKHGQISSKELTEFIRER